MLDLGCGVSFSGAVAKLKEHYGITIAASSERRTVLEHGDKIKSQLAKDISSKNNKSRKLMLNNKPGTSFIISETDGSMVPIVVNKKSGKDMRKHKEVMYRELRLSMARNSISQKGIFAATFDEVNYAGKCIRYCVDKAGCGGNSKIHAVGDGAVWIAEQVDKQFGTQATYLIDFYHASEYLAAAALEVAPDSHKKWLHTQQQLLKVGRHQQVINNLKRYAMMHKTGEAVKCYHYLKRREHQLNYHVAIKHDLPIGSGEIESAHRYIVQSRMKIPGAWWNINNAQSMISINVLRANGEWEKYWENQNAA